MPPQCRRRHVAETLSRSCWWATPPCITFCSGVDPRELGGAPFSLVTHAALDVKARDLGLQAAPGANVYIPAAARRAMWAPTMSACWWPRRPISRMTRLLILDVGTNGEILLGNRERLLSASSPTGPAFEGAQIMPRHARRPGRDRARAHRPGHA